MLASHWALWTSTGQRRDVGVPDVVRREHRARGRPGTGVPARAGPASTATVAEKTSATARTRTARGGRRCPPTGVPPSSPPHARIIGTTVAGTETDTGPAPNLGRPLAHPAPAPAGAEPLALKFSAGAADNQ